MTALREEPPKEPLSLRLSALYVRVSGIRRGGERQGGRGSERMWRWSEGQFEQCTVHVSTITRYTR